MTRGAWQRCLWPYACPTRSADNAPRRIKLHCVATGGTMSRVSDTQCKQLVIGLSRSRCYRRPRRSKNVPAGTPWPSSITVLRGREGGRGEEPQRGGQPQAEKDREQ